MKLKFKRADAERMLMIVAAVLVVALAVRGGEPAVTTMYEEPMPETLQTTSSAGADEVAMQATVCWYEDGDGYLVPVTRQVPQQDGIARATLGLMVKSSANDLAAARLGLTNVIPEGVTFDLDISGGKARLDMSREALNCSTAEEELLMVHGAAAALCGFDTVDEVTFLFDGQKRSRLTHGTDVSGAFTGELVNAESVSAMTSAHADQVQLYFPSASGRLLVPVTRTVFSPADLATAMLELAKGPRSDSGLEAPLPADCGVRSVTVKDGVATIDFTEELLRVLAGQDGGDQALRAVLFTAGQFPGVEKVNLLVDGEPFAPQNAAPTFLNDADTVAAQYPGVIELD